MTLGGVETVENVDVERLFGFSYPNRSIHLIGIQYLPGPFKGCQMVAKGCQFILPWDLIGTPWKVLVPTCMIDFLMVNQVRYTSPMDVTLQTNSSPLKKR